MTVPVLEEAVLLRPADLEPLVPGYRIVGVFNPAAARFGEGIVLLVRVAEQPVDPAPGQVAAPRVVWPERTPTWILDTFDAGGVITQDPRILQFPDGRVRLPHISHLRLVHLNADASQVKDVVALPELQPQREWEELGIEDPRISQIGDTYYITYVAISRHMGVTTALMTTTDFRTFERHGIIFPTENKDVVLLPEKRDGAFVAFHRPVPHTGISAPSITASHSPDGVHWGNHHLVIGPRGDSWDTVKVGAGAPPVRLPQGWLLIYHGVDTATAQSPVGCYCAGAMLLDLDDPCRVLARSDQPLLRPYRIHEQTGFVPNVIFPTGVIPDDDRQTISIFMGAADEVVTMQRVSIPTILDHLGVG